MWPRAPLRRTSIAVVAAAAAAASACDHDDRPASSESRPAPDGPARLLASYRHVRAGSDFFEGAIYFLRIPGADRRPVVLGDRSRPIVLPPGPYRLVAYARACVASCPFGPGGRIDVERLDQPSTFCDADVRLEGVHEVTVTFRGAETCRMALRRVR